VKRKEEEKDNPSNMACTIIATARMASDMLQAAMHLMHLMRPRCSMHDPSIDMDVHVRVSLNAVSTSMARLIELGIFTAEHVATVLSPLHFKAVNKVAIDAADEDNVQCMLVKPLADVIDTLFRIECEKLSKAFAAAVPLALSGDAGAGASMVGIARELDMAYAVASGGESSGLMSEGDEARLLSLMKTDMMRAVADVAGRVAAVATASLVFKIAFGVVVGPQIVEASDVSHKVVDWVREVGPMEAMDDIVM
jgi:hypothetical protein